MLVLKFREFRDIQGHVGNHLHPLGHKGFAAGAPDLFSIIFVVRHGDFMDGGEGLSLAKQPGVGHQLPGTAEVVTLAAEVVVEILGTVKGQGEGMKHGAAEGGNQGQNKGQDNKGYQYHRPSSPAAQIKDGLRQTAYHPEYRRDEHHTDKDGEQVGDQLRQIVRRQHIHTDDPKKFSYDRSHENPPFRILAQAARNAASSRSKSRPSITV